MKIILSVTTLTPGSGLSQYIFNLCKILDGVHEIIVISTHDSKENDFAVSQFESINPNIKYINLGSHNKYRRYLDLIRIINAEKPDILINNYDAPVQFILPFIRKKTKVVHVLHNDWVDFYRIGAINAKNVTTWIAPTKAIRDHFNEFTSHKYDQRVKVVSHGVEVAGANHAKKEDLLEITFVGVVGYHKGADLLPAIIRNIQKKNVQFHISILGDGPEMDNLKEELAGEINSGQVELTGVVSHSEVYNRLSQSDIFLYPTRIDAFGLVIAEAMTNGAVAIVTHLPGVTDNLIENSVDGFLIKIDDVSGFSDKIEMLSKDKKKLASISYAGQKKIDLLFSMSQMKDNYLNLLEEIHSKDA